MGVCVLGLQLLRPGCKAGAPRSLEGASLLLGQALREVLLQTSYELADLSKLLIALLAHVGSAVGLGEDLLHN